jgi:hypothetical protein
MIAAQQPSLPPDSSFTCSDASRLIPHRFTNLPLRCASLHGTRPPALSTLRWLSTPINPAASPARCGTYPKAPASHSLWRSAAFNDHEVLASLSRWRRYRNSVGVTSQGGAVFSLFSRRYAPLDTVRKAVPSSASEPAPARQPSSRFPASTEPQPTRRLRYCQYSLTTQSRTIRIFCLRRRQTLFPVES